jgi:hypothetical protein
VRGGLLLSGERRACGGNLVSTGVNLAVRVVKVRFMTVALDLIALIVFIWRLQNKFAWCAAINFNFIGEAFSSP